MKTLRPFKRARLRSARPQSGTTIVETVIAAGVLLTCIAGVLSLFTLSTGLNASQGEDATRNPEYAGDKMEQLMVLPFNDPGLGDNMAANHTAGSINSSSPVTGYVDYLDATGNVLSGSTGAFYIRQWQVVTSTAVDGSGVPRLKTITVMTRVVSNVSGRGLIPSTTVTAIKANF